MNKDLADYQGSKYVRLAASSCPHPSSPSLLLLAHWEERDQRHSCSAISLHPVGFSPRLKHTHTHRYTHVNTGSIISVLLAGSRDTRWPKDVCMSSDDAPVVLPKLLLFLPKPCHGKSVFLFGTGNTIIQGNSSDYNCFLANFQATLKGLALDTKAVYTSWLYLIPHYAL